MIRAVIDTNVLVAALRSSSGASHQILLAADRSEFEVALSVPLLAEYDDVCHRPESGISIPTPAVDSVIDRIAQIAHEQSIHYLWRGILPDPKDDMSWKSRWRQGHRISSHSTSSISSKPRSLGSP